jgi:hypothetical protein
MVYYKRMKNNRMVYVVLGIIVLALVAGTIVRYKVLQGRTQIDTKLVTDFSSCLEARGGLDITGTVCTSAAGETYTKPGVIAATTTPIETPVPAATTTVSTSTESGTLSLGVATTFMLHDAKALLGGPTVILDAIHDSRCKPGVQCIWAGEFSTDWKITTIAGTKTITLGTVRVGTLTESVYTYTLSDANVDHAILTVTKATAANTTGSVTGTVTIGPICPVESIDHPCVIPPETYTSRSVVVYAADKVTELEQHALDATGHYTFTLKPGTYGLQIRPAGIGAGEIKPVTVVAKGTTTVNFDIDTGIR